jgi:hypothetical protein
MCPHTQEDFLGHLFGIGLIAEHSAGERNHTRKMPVNQKLTGRLISLRHAGDQYVV